MQPTREPGTADPQQGAMSELLARIDGMERLLEQSAERERELNQTLAAMAAAFAARTPGATPVAPDEVPAPQGPPAGLSARQAAAQMPDWLRYLVDMQGHSAAHAKQCGLHVQRWLRYLGAHGNALTPRACMDWQMKQGEAGRLHPHTLQNRSSACRRFCTWLRMREAIPTNPWDGIPSPRGRTGQGADCMTLEEVRRLVDYTRSLAASIPESSRWRRAAVVNRANLYEFLVLTGLRRSESRAQRWEDIDLKAGTLTVTADKAKRKDRIPLNRPALELLARMRAEQPVGDLVFPQIVTDKAMEADCKACGLEGRGKWHRFRVAFITDAFRRRVRPELIQRLARHKTIDQTFRYFRGQEHELREATERIGYIVSPSDDATPPENPHDPQA